MSKSLGMFLCVAALSAVSLDAAARGPGGAGGMGGGGWGGSPGGMAASPSSHAMTNSNGPFAADRDTGLSRAEDRMSAQGLSHEQATGAAQKHHGHSGGRHNSTTDADAR